MKKLGEQEWIGKVVAAILLPAVLALAGCPSQSQVASLVQVLGNDASAIATLQGDTSLATKLTTDTAAAVTAVVNWKTGTSSQEAVEALNLVIADLNLIPDVGPYAAYITLAVGTAQTIITLLSPSSAPSITGITENGNVWGYPAHTAVVVPTVKQFKQQCLALNIPNPKAICK